MPKIIMTFSIPEEKEEFDLAFNGPTLSCVVEEILSFLRKKIKYESDKYSEQEIKVYKEIKDEIFSLLKEKNVDFF